MNSRDYDLPSKSTMPIMTNLVIMKIYLICLLWFGFKCHCHVATLTLAQPIDSRKKCLLSTGETEVRCERNSTESLKELQTTCCVFTLYKNPFRIPFQCVCIGYLNASTWLIFESFDSDTSWFFIYKQKSINRKWKEVEGSGKGSKPPCDRLHKVKVYYSRVHCKVRQTFLLLGRRLCMQLWRPDGVLMLC